MYKKIDNNKIYIYKIDGKKIYICKKIDDKKIYLYIKIDDITPQQMEAELEEIVILDEPSIAETIYLTG